MQPGEPLTTPVIDIGRAWDLALFATHLPSCETQWRKGSRNCTCGFSAAMSAAFPDRFELDAWWRAHRQPRYLIRAETTCERCCAPIDEGKRVCPSCRKVPARSPKRRAGPRIRKPREHPAEVMLRAVRRRYRDTCAICEGTGCDSMQMVVPRRRGGANAVSNLRPVHASCKAAQGRRKFGSEG